MERQLQEELYEVETKINEIKDLMREKLTDEKLEQARSTRDKYRGNKTHTYLIERKKASLSTTLHTHSALALGDILKTKMKLSQYPDDLESTLNTLAEWRVTVLESALAHHKLVKRGMVD